METIFLKRERSCCTLTVHIFILLHIYFFPDHSHLFSLVSSTDVSELLSPLGNEHFTLLSGWESAPQLLA